MIALTYQAPSERSIPGFQACLRPQDVLDACKSQLLRVDAAERDQWTSAKCIEALYHPGRYVRIAYVLLHDGDIEAHRYWPEGQLVYLNAPLRAPLSRRGDMLRIDSADVEAYAFPNDRRLRGLRKFAGRDTTAATWALWSDNAGGGRINPETLQRLLVRYVPEQKWIIRLRAEFTPSGGGKPVKRRLAVRCARPTMHAVLRQRHDALNGLEAGDAPTFCVPKIIGSVDENTVLAVEWIRGESFIERLQSGDEKQVMLDVVQRLSNLHQTYVPGLPTVTPVGLAESARLACEDLAAAEPKWKDELDDLAEILCGALKRVVVDSPVTLHNDLHCRQISCKREKVILFDLERMATGDALRDVAALATQIKLCGPRPDFDVSVEEADRWSRLFEETWCSISGAPVNRWKMSVYAALTALELGRGMMRHLRPDWSSITRTCIEFAMGQCTGNDTGLA